MPDLDEDSVPLLEALRERGVDALPVVWSDSTVDWAGFDGVLVRSTWDYIDHLDEFLAWVASVPVPLFNPPDVIAWNAHKSYLRDLEERGVPVVATEWVPRGERREIAWRDAIVKPAVAGSAKGLRRVVRGDVVEAGEDLLVQPFLPSIESEGELSLLYAAGAHSHAVRKTPRRGDIRVQPEWGGSADLVEADREARHVAERALQAVEADLLYARVDLVRAPDATLRLIELELIEPSLFLLGNPTATARFAGAFSAAFARSP
jgi:glutathione synthase/RimK-type ligase-like ATP-grasp enzyme